MRAGEDASSAPSRRAPTRRDAGVALYLACAVVTLAVLAPALLAARLQLGFPTVSSVSGIPVAFHGFYFFTGVAVGAGGFAAFRRGETVAASAALAVAGLGGFEFLYGVAYATSTSQASLLVPRWGFPASGWAGFGTWLVVEFLVASLGLICWDRFGFDRTVFAAGLVFAVGLGVWGLLLGWSYPPYDNSPLVYLVNTVTEVAGTLLIPLICTSGSKREEDFVQRFWRRVIRPPIDATTSAK